MGDAENELHPSKKRAALREISRDNPGLDDDEDAPEQETGTFKRASDEVLAGRRIVKVRRQQNPTAASSNPFAGISLVPPPKPDSSAISTVTTETQLVGQKPATDEVDSGTEKGLAETGTNGEDKQLESKSEDKVAGSSVDEEKTVAVNEGTNPESTDEKEEKKEDKENNGEGDTDPSGAAAPLSSFQQLSSTQNAFTGLAGTGFSTSSFSFGLIPKEGSAFGSGSGSLFGLKNDKTPSFPPLNLGNSNNGTSLFGSTGTSDVTTKSEGSSLPSMQEVPVETGEENEKAVFTADAVLFEYLDGGWKERGKGELKVNVSTAVVDRARLVMRARGNYRLILNASLYPDMKLTNMDKRGITFACLNSSTGEGNDGLSTFALKFKDGSVVEEFRTVVTAHKGKKTTVLKTPENSPKASDD
ncbi:Ran binding domain [Macleaya cordata]|uniref:Ran binding domain n=1 Tax=Macleaya cordata TaxID=56857 RepID=A0A200PNE6_MACCD|nr:Ran binding domain [Macleaya cordata]